MKLRRQTSSVMLDSVAWPGTWSNGFSGSAGGKGVGRWKWIREAETGQRQNLITSCDPVFFPPEPAYPGVAVSPDDWNISENRYGGPATKAALIVAGDGGW